PTAPCPSSWRAPTPVPTPDLTRTMRRTAGLSPSREAARAREQSDLDSPAAGATIKEVRGGSHEWLPARRPERQSNENGRQAVSGVARDSTPRPLKGRGCPSAGHQRRLLRGARDAGAPDRPARSSTTHPDGGADALARRECPPHLGGIGRERPRARLKPWGRRTLGGQPMTRGVNVARKQRQTKPGIELRHARSCASNRGKPCTCTPKYRATAWSKRDGKLIRRAFPTEAAAVLWR